jgi:cell fate regulator YaaT (PSP1 superfamily)
MEDIVGVRFQEAGKIYYFSSAGYDNLEVGEYVVVETTRGPELARVIIAPGQVLNAELTEPLKPITRVAFDDDIEQAERLKRKAEEAVAIARQKAHEANLQLKVFSGSFDLEGKRLSLLFTSEERVDFRDLAREVSAATGAQIQLRQVGPRDQAKVVGGYGRCGRRLCCTSWLVAFPAISIKMAKEQDLPLNPSKISGQCGRLLCCLSYENDMYREVKQALPRPGTYLSTPTGNARVLAVNVPRETVTLQMETMQTIDVPIQEMGIDRGLVRIISGPPPSERLERRPLPGRPDTRDQNIPEGGPGRRRQRGMQPAQPERHVGPTSARQPVEAKPAPPPASAEVRPPSTPVATPAEQGASPAQPARPAGHRRRRRRGGSGARPQAQR